MNDVHVHDHKKIDLVRIDRIQNKFYKGTAGDKAFLMRSCECGDKKAFEYGNTAEMKQLLKELESK